MSNICAGIGRGQMEVLPQRVAKRREIFEFYRDELSDINGISFPKEPDGFFSNRWLTTIILDEAVLGEGVNEKIRLNLEKLNIESRPLWKPLHQQPVFSDCTHYGNGVSDRLFATGLCLPSGSNTSQENLEKVVTEIINCLS
jgi:dTDP-4-amino-4,6-dideoxygalactose transaminase